MGRGTDYLKNHWFTLKINQNYRSIYKMDQVLFTNVNKLTFEGPL